MENSHSDDIVKYLTSRENLPYTLDIVSRGDEIRRRVFWEFWCEAHEKLRRSVPKTLASQELAWDLWPGEKKMDSESAGVYLWPAQFSGHDQGISFSVASDLDQSLFFGLVWEKPPKPSVLKAASVAKLIAFLTENKFKPTKWWLGWKYIKRNQDEDGLLLGYAKDRDGIFRQIQESFWPLVEESFDMVVKANRAVR